MHVIALAAISSPDGDALRRRGWTVETVQAPEQLIASARLGHSTIVILDAKRSNVRAWASLRRDPELGRIPVLVRSDGFGADGWFLRAGIYGESLAWIDVRATSAELLRSTEASVRDGSTPWRRGGRFWLQTGTFVACVALSCAAIGAFLSGRGFSWALAAVVAAAFGMLSLVFPIALRAAVRRRRIPPLILWNVASSFVTLVLAVAGWLTFR